MYHPYFRNCDLHDKICPGKSEKCQKDIIYLWFPPKYHGTCVNICKIGTSLMNWTKLYSYSDYVFLPPGRIKIESFSTDYYWRWKIGFLQGAKELRTASQKRFTLYLVGFWRNLNQTTSLVYIKDFGTYLLKKVNFNVTNTTHDPMFQRIEIWLGYYASPAYTFQNL